MKNSLYEKVSIIHTKIDTDINYPFKKKLQVHYVKPEVSKELIKNKYYFDFGKVRFGSLELEVKSNRKNKFNIKMMEFINIKVNIINRYSIGFFEKEYLNLNGIINVNPPQRSLPRKKDIPLNIDGVIPFRYLLLETNLDISEFSVRQIAITYPFSKNLTEFESSNLTLDRVFNLAKQTVISTSFSGLYIDGNRERKPYEADAYYNQISHYAIDDDISMARNTQLYLIKNPTWPLEWSFFSIFMAKEDYMQTGDKAFIKKIYNLLNKRVFLSFLNEKYFLDIEDSGEYLIMINGKNLKPIIDWPPVERKGFSKEEDPNYKRVSTAVEILLRRVRSSVYSIYGLNSLEKYQDEKIQHLVSSKYRITPNNFVINAYHYQAILDMAFLAEEIGFFKESEKLSDIAKVLKINLNKEFYDNKTKLYKDSNESNVSSFHSNLFAIAFDIVPDKRKKYILSFLEKNKYKSSVFTSFFLMKSLFDNNMGEEAISYITSNNPRNWSNMLRNKATLTTEAWDSSIKENMDWSHPWGSTPIYHVVRNIIGVKPLSPKYQSILVEPKPGKLDWFKSKVKTPIGFLKVDYRINENTVLYKVKLPAKVKKSLFLINIPKYCSVTNIILNKKIYSNKIFYKKIYIPIRDTAELKYLTSCSTNDS